MTAPKKNRAKRNYSAQADKLCGALVRARGVCEAAGPRCSGPFQWAHGFSRRYRAVRWDQRNGFCLCAGHHYWFTLNPLAWDDFLHERWGDDLYAEMRALAVAGVKPDLPSLVDSLKKAAA